MGVIRLKQGKHIEIVTRNDEVFYMDYAGDIDSIINPKNSTNVEFVKVYDISDNELYLRASEVIMIYKVGG